MTADFRAHFRRQDPILHGLIRQVGPYTLKPKRDRFGMLVRSIIAQQISTAAARSIHARLAALLDSEKMTAASLAALSVEQLRSVGLSPQKASYVHDLAEKVASGIVNLPRIGRLPDEEVIETLVQVKGIGRWTAQMFLIFALGRPDVFPVDDFGVRSAMIGLYGLAPDCKKAALLEIGAKWSPYASVGSWYCWRYLDLRKGKPATV